MHVLYVLTHLLRRIIVLGRSSGVWLSGRQGAMPPSLLGWIRSVIMCFSVKKGDTSNHDRTCSHNPRLAPAKLWSIRKQPSCAASLDDGRVRSLLDTCLIASARQFDDLPSAHLASLHADLMQMLLEHLVAAGTLSLAKLQRVGLPADIHSLSLDGPCCSEAVDDALVCEIGRCPRLRALDLSRCTLVTDEGIRGLGSSRQLQHLQLNYCVQVTDACLGHISGLTSLQTLELGGCEQLSGQGLAGIARLCQLSKLRLPACRGVQGGLKHLAGLSQLAQLDLGWCTGLEDNELACLAHLTLLTNLNLSASKVSDAGLHQLSCLTRLSKLNLHGCSGLTPACARCLGTCFRGLRCLDLGQCYKFGDAGLPELQPLTQLQCLNLGGSSVTDAGLLALGPLSGLTRLDLDSCSIGDVGCKVLQHLPLLQRLDLSDTDVQDATLELLGRFHTQHLAWLNLSCTCVTSAGMSQLKTMRGITHLNIDSVPLDDLEVQVLSGLQGLRSLEACSMRLHELGTAAIAKLTALTKLELCGGGLGDRECCQLSRLPLMVRLSLAYNKHITDMGLRAMLLGMPLLQELNMSGTSIRTGAVQALATLQELHVLSICNTCISEAAVQALKSQLPRCCLVKHSYKKFQD